MHEVTLILSAVEQGDAKAAEQLLELVYGELRRLAAQKLAQEKPGQTLDATGLVHEAYLRLFGSDGEPQHWDSRGHFFAAAAEAMRRILIDNARRKKRLKHGGDRQQVELQEQDIAVFDAPEELLALDEAMASLAQEDPRGGTIRQAARVCRFVHRTGRRIAWCLACNRLSAVELCPRLAALPDAGGKPTELESEKKPR